MDLSQSKFHFVGIGGIGMSGLAELLVHQGAQVTGSDLKSNAQTARLESQGVTVFLGHQAGNISDQDVLVYSSAVKSSNPEVQRAFELKIPVIRRAEALAEVMRLKRGIAIAGTHGKTTTSSLVASVLMEGQLDPTIVVGGRLRLLQSTARLGKGDWFVAEADESDGSFDRLSPEIAVITNIDSDHLDHFGDFETVQRAFFDFAEKIPFYGEVIACGDDPVVRKVFADFPKRITYYGFHETNDYRLQAEDGGYHIVFKQGDEEVRTPKLELHIPGRHNILNACAAFICGLRTGLQVEPCIQGLRSFEGVDRRFEFVGRVSGADVIDDYGHHPTEVNAVLLAARERYPDRQIRVLFQPHRYSRTQASWEQFHQSFQSADEVIITDIYPAGESPIEGVSGLSLAQSIDHEKCQFQAWNEELAAATIEGLNEKSVLIVMGAGNISSFAHQLVRDHGNPV